MSKVYQSYAWLYNRYVQKNMTITQIAKECGVSEQVIQYWLTKHGLVRNARTWKR